MQKALAVLRGAFAYTHGVPTGFTTGDMATDPSAGRSTLSPGILKGLDSLAVAPTWSVFTDPLGRVTRTRVDSADHLVVTVAPNGGTTTVTRDSNGWITKIADPLNRVTSLVRDSAGYVTQLTTPDGNSLGYTYQTALHALTQFSDQRGDLSSYAYDPNNGHLLTAKGALSHVTSYSYNPTSGLQETVDVNANGYDTTLSYDACGRVKPEWQAFGTVTYDYDLTGIANSSPFAKAVFPHSSADANHTMICFRRRRILPRLVHPGLPSAGRLGKPAGAAAGSGELEESRERGAGSAYPLPT